MSFSAGFIGTIEGKNPSPGATSAGSKTPANSAMPERYWKAPLSRCWSKQSVKRCANKDSFLSVLKDNIETVISHENDTTLADIDKRLEELQTELVKLANSKVDYDKVGEEIYRLRDQKQKLQLEAIGRDELKKRIADMGDFLERQPTAITEYDEQLVRRLIEKNHRFRGQIHRAI